jgi:hypothetical protein
LRGDRQARRREDAGENLDQRIAAGLSGSAGRHIIPEGEESVMQADLPPGTRQTIAQQGGLSSDTRALMLFEANKKTALVRLHSLVFPGPVRRP